MTKRAQQLEHQLPLEIELVDAPIGYAFCLQRGKGANAERLDYQEVNEKSAGRLKFKLDIRVRSAKDTGLPDYFGPFVQGKTASRFFYICVGEVVERGDPNWAGRVKVPLSGISWDQINTVRGSNHPLYARFQASDSNGKPMFASVKLLHKGWSLDAMSE